jgi:hypothetical protein
MLEIPHRNFSGFSFWWYARAKERGLYFHSSIIERL